MNKFIMITPLLLLNLALCGCSERPEQNGGDEDFDVGETERELPEIPCMDPEFVGYDADAHENAYSNLLSSAEYAQHSYPTCRREDGLGTHSNCEDEDRNDQYYFYCKDPIRENYDGSTVEYEEPCIWWIMPEYTNESYCTYPVVCVPEDRLDELGWPDDAEFDFHQVYGIDLCNRETWF